ncbi:MAG: Uma2 family endonuclease [Spirochaetes bacterium]|nr:Uma2 family endonuclease [Spirochaetota bacterium]
MAYFLEKNDKPLSFEPPARGFTYRDYEKWDDDIRLELIDGAVYLMSSPTEWHRWVCGELFWQLKSHFRGKACNVYSELDVRPFYQEGDSDQTVVRPNIIVVCDEGKVFGKKNCEGAPDFIIEVLSEGTAGRDLADKKTQKKSLPAKARRICVP